MVFQTWVFGRHFLKSEHNELITTFIALDTIQVFKKKRILENVYLPQALQLSNN